MAEEAGIVQQGDGGRRQQAVPSEGEPAGQLLAGNSHAHQIYLLEAGEGQEPATSPWHGQSSLVGTGPLLRKGPFPLLAGEMLTGGPEGPGFMTDWLDIISSLFLAGQGMGETANSPAD